MLFAVSLFLRILDHLFTVLLCNVTRRQASVLPPDNDPDFAESDTEGATSSTNSTGQTEAQKAPSSTWSEAQAVAFLSDQDTRDMLTKMLAFFNLNNPALNVTCHVAAAKAVNDVALSMSRDLQAQQTQTDPMSELDVLLLLVRQACGVVAAVFPDDAAQLHKDACNGQQQPARPDKANSYQPTSQPT